MKRRIAMLLALALCALLPLGAIAEEAVSEAVEPQAEELSLELAMPEGAEAEDALAAPEDGGAEIAAPEADELLPKAGGRYWDDKKNWYDYEITDAGAVITKGYLAGDVVLAPTLEGVPVVGIGRSAFNMCFTVTSVVLPETVTDIGEGAFRACKTMTTINIPAGVTSIGDGAFSDCAALLKLELPATMRYIGEQAFRDCKSLGNLTLPAGVTTYGTYAFLNCESMTELVFPEGVTEIGDSACMGCANLDSVSLPNGLKTIKANAFNTTDALTEITIPGSVTKIGDYAFAGKKSFIIRGVKGSAAEAYAKKEKYTFIPIEGELPAAEGQGLTIRQGKSASLAVGAKLSLTAETDAAKLTWKSGDKKIATVSSKGVVKGIKQGTVTITVKDENGASAKIKIKVTPAATSIKIKQGKSASVKVNKTLKLKATLKPSGTASKVTWKSSDKKIATVSSKGVVKGVKKGTVTITAKTDSGKKAKIKIKVK